MKVSRSSYYAYRSSKTYRITDRQKKLDERVKDLFVSHWRRIGSKRMVTEYYKKHHERIGRCAVRRSYRRQSLVAIRPRSTMPWTTDSDHNLAISPNLLLDGKNKPSGAGEVIVGDITYLPLLTGKFTYLAMFQDMFTKQLVGWTVSDSLKAEIVVTALKKAIFKGMIKKNAIVHTDRGSQYASNVYRDLLKENDFRQSMSRKGNCYDNAQAESFFARLKIELLEGGKFDTTDTARTEIFSYIEGYYNRIRPHSAINNMAPDEFAEEFNKVTDLTETTLPAIMPTKIPPQQAAI